jgi:hypothetical protein
LLPIPDEAVIEALGNHARNVRQPAPPDLPRKASSNFIGAIGDACLAAARGKFEEFS